MTMRRGIIAITMLTLAVAACARSGDNVTLSRITNSGDGPDEFTVLPTKPLQTPASYSALPAPTPGGSNLVDRHPLSDGIAALGGRPSAAVPDGRAPAESGLVNYTRRYGVTPGIRRDLAVEDAETRRRHGRVNILRLGKTDDYTDAYKKQWLDAYAEKDRLERYGVVTPSAPPPQ